MELVMLLLGRLVEYEVGWVGVQGGNERGFDGAVKPRWGGVVRFLR